VKEELCELVLLQDIGRVRARSLYRAGYKDLKALSRASIEDLEKVPGIGVSLARSIKEQLSKHG
jgi:helicase